jgi:hypothetical protein
MEWQASTAYALNSIVTPVTQNGTYFLAIQGGTSGSSQPTWPGVGGKVTDGGVTWLYLGNYDNQPVYPPWSFGTADGQGDPGTITLDIEQSLVGLGGPPDVNGSFWSRFIVMFDPVPTSWTDIVNPPVGTSDPSSAEISVLQEIIANFKPGKSTCVGILGLPSGLTRACWGFPLTTTTNIPFSCFLSRAIATGDAPNSTAFVATRPQSVYSWLPNTAVANAGGSTYIFTTPSSAKLNGYLYSSPASSGTTGFTEPTWPTSLGGTVTDNGITWTCIATLYEWSQQQGDTIFAF